MASQLIFDWDADNVRHLSRHRVKPTDFEQVMLNNPILFDHQDVEGEDRWTGLGATDALQVLTVVFTIRGRRIRAVTAFSASKRNVRLFWERRGE